MSYLDKTNLSNEEKVDILTDGTPDTYQTHLLGYDMPTTDDWLQKAIKIENILNKSSKPYQQSTRSTSNCTIQHCDHTSSPGHSQSPQQGRNQFKGTRPPIQNRG